MTTEAWFIQIQIMSLMSHMNISLLNFNIALSNTYPLKYNSWQEDFPDPSDQYSGLLCLKFFKHR